MAIASRARSCADILTAARKLGLEGIVSKRVSAPYRSGRSSTWVKVKCKRSDTFTVIGFADETGSDPPRVGALYVGRREGKHIARSRSACRSGRQKRCGCSFSRSSGQGRASGAR
jgi:ATP-dependent DNA ligase